jgi:hypothetical protein
MAVAQRPVVEAHEGVLLVLAHRELHHDPGGPLGRRAVDVLDALDGAELGLEGREHQMLDLAREGSRQGDAGVLAVLAAGRELGLRAHACRLGACHADLGLAQLVLGKGLGARKALEPLDVPVRLERAGTGVGICGPAERTFSYTLDVKRRVVNECEPFGPQAVPKCMTRRPPGGRSRRGGMHVVIAGGTGLIGTALGRSLITDGHRVTVLGRDPGRARVAPGVALRRWDARSAEGWVDVVEGADAFVNLAGESLAGTGPLPARWTPAQKQRIRDSRLHAGRAVLEAFQAASSRPGVLVQASGVGYYGPLEDAVATEQTPAGSDFLARLAADWEASTAAVETLGVRRVVARTGVVLAMAGGALPRLVLPYRLFAGGPLGSGRQWVPWIHLADEVAAIRFLIGEAAARGPFNLTAPGATTNAELGRTLGRVLGRPSLLPAPAFALRTLLGEVADLVLTGQRAVPAQLEAAGFRFRFPELEPALRDLLAA